MKNNKKYYITLTIVSILTLFLIFVLWSFSDDSKVSGSCSINNIDYVNVSPSECWTKNINETYCPLPRDISCNGEIVELGNLIWGIIRGN